MMVLLSIELDSVCFAILDVVFHSVRECEDSGKSCFQRGGKLEVNNDTVEWIFVHCPEARGEYA